MEWTEKELQDFREQICNNQVCNAEDCLKTKDEIDSCAEELIGDADEWY